MTSIRQMEHLLERLTEAFFLVDGSWTVTYANPEAVRLFGIAKERLIGADLRELAGDLKGSAIGQCYREAMIGRSDQVFEDYVEALGRSYRVRIYPEGDGIAVYVQDTTDARTIRNKLTDTSERFRAMFEHAGLGVALTDLKGYVLEANPMFIQTLGYEEQELQVMNYAEYTHPEDLMLDGPHLQLLLNGEQQKYKIHKRFITKDGRTIWARQTVTLVRNGTGEPEFMLGMFEDITERKMAEIALNESNERIRNILDSITEGFFALDGDWRVIYVNREAERILREERGKLLGQPIWTMLPELTKMTLFGKAKRAMEMGVNVTFQQFVPHIQSWFDVRIYRSKDGLSVYFQDITDKKEAERALKESEEWFRTLSFVDGLTGVRNRRYFDEQLESEWSRCSRNGSPLALLLVDIDYFKRYNDTYGHLKGDDCLKQVASELERAAGRPGDVVARFGGEEFAIILPETNAKGAEHVAETIRAGVEKLRLLHEGSKLTSWVTVSVGGAVTVPSMERDPNWLVDQADQALYEAKQERNRTAVRKL